MFQTFREQCLIVLEIIIWSIRFVDIKLDKYFCLTFIPLKGSWFNSEILFFFHFSANACHDPPRPSWRSTAQWSGAGSMSRQNVQNFLSFLKFSQIIRNIQILKSFYSPKIFKNWEFNAFKLPFSLHFCSWFLFSYAFTIWFFIILCLTKSII